MNIIEQIRAEIERLKGQLVRGACASQVQLETNCKEEAYNEILSFLDTLKEQPVDLEKEINDYTSKHFFGSQTQGFFSSRTHGDIDCVDIVLVARHFAQWGADHLKK